MKVKSGQDKSVQVKVGQGELGQVQSGQAEARQVKPGQVSVPPMPDTDTYTRTKIGILFWYRYELMVSVSV